MAALYTRRRKEDKGLADLVPEWHERARALGLVREETVLSPSRPLDPATGDRARLPHVPAPDLPPNRIRSMKRAPALPRQPGDDVAATAGVNPVPLAHRRRRSCRKSPSGASWRR